MKYNNSLIVFALISLGFSSSCSSNGKENKVENIKITKQKTDQKKKDSLLEIDVIVNNNKLLLIQERYSSGEIEKEFYLNQDSLRDSVFYSFYKNGNIKSRGTFTKGSKHGDWYIYNENGNKKMYFSYGLNEEKSITRKYWDDGFSFAEWRINDDMTYEGRDRNDTIIYF